MRDGEFHALGYKAAANWWGLGKQRAPLGRTPHHGLLQGVLNGTETQLAAEGIGWLAWDSALLNYGNSLLEVIIEINPQISNKASYCWALVVWEPAAQGNLALHPAVPDSPAVWGAFSGTMSSQGQGLVLVM